MLFSGNAIEDSQFIIPSSVTICNGKGAAEGECALRLIVRLGYETHKFGEFKHNIDGEQLECGNNFPVSVPLLPQLSALQALANHWAG